MQLLLVARREFVKPLRLVVVPLAQLFGWCDVFAPDAHPLVILADSVRPDAIDQDTLAVVGIDVFIDAGHPHPCLAHHCASV
ncbi:Uncharacterised protein [Mycobacterium tuberculosis]|uniref:Uncharacterized protein n=1 Tax=Mycobacterium tuberculosis TaxID=1773 RepID=A0A916LHV0_MYCTX|nr:Uncharacterised protein [Mycobacterium tuberculosis]